MVHMSKTERRFRERLGKPFLENGRIRCQAVSKQKIRHYREETGDYDTPTDDFFPEFQCRQPAEEGCFICRWHGGKSVAIQKKPRDILDVMPIDLANMMRTLRENPTYYDRRNEIVLMQSRVWQLLNQMEVTEGDDSAWDLVHEAFVCLKAGDEMGAYKNLNEALSRRQDVRDSWKEIRETTKIIDSLTGTQMKTLKDLQLMASAEEVMYLIANLQQAISDGAVKYVKDNDSRIKFLRHISEEIKRFANLGARTIIEGIEPGSSES